MNVCRKLGREIGFRFVDVCDFQGCHYVRILHAQLASR